MNAPQRPLTLDGADAGPLAPVAGRGSTALALFHGFTSGPVSITGGALALDAAAHRPVAGAVVVNPAVRRRP